MTMIDLRTGNCIELAKGLKDNSIDCTVTSPPYNKCGVGGGLFRKIEYAAFDDTLPEDASIFTIFLGRRGYYLNRKYKNEPSFGMNAVRQMVISSASEKTFDLNIRSMNVTHILVRSDLFYKFLNDNFSKAEIKCLLNHIKKRWIKLYDNNGYAVWDVQA